MNVSNATWMRTIDRTGGAATVKVTTASGGTVLYRVPTRSLIEYAKSAGPSASALSRAH